MRTFTVCLLLTTVTFAKDTAADLFYKAFWLEQAGGKAKAAEAYYERIVREYGRAEETPRALLGLVRIRAGRGEAVDRLLKQLEKDHPDAQEEIAQARRIASSQSKSFDDEHREGDSPMTLKLKSLYGQLGGRGISDRDKNFLIDAGRAAHPMLRARLRAETHDSVRWSAEILMAQQTPEAYRLLEEALADEHVLFKMAIVSSVSGNRSVPEYLVTAMERLYDQASPRLKIDLARAFCRVVRAEGKSRERAYAVLARALQDRDDDVREAAWQPRFDDYDQITNAYLDAMLAGMGRKDPAIYDKAYEWLPHLAHRTGYFDRIQKVLSGYPSLNGQRLRKPAHDDGALLLARVALEKHDAGDRSPNVRFWFPQKAGEWSGAAAAELLAAGLDRGAAEIVDQTGLGIDRSGAAVVSFIGAKNVAQLRVAALEATYVPAKSGAALELFTILPLQEQHHPLVVDTAKRHRGRGLPRPALTEEYITKVGPAKAAELAPYCKSEVQASRFLSAGYQCFVRRLPSPAAEHVTFFDKAIPKAGHHAWAAMYEIAKRDTTLATLVAQRMLDAREKEWGWTMPDAADRARTDSRRRRRRTSNAPGPNIWNRTKIPEVCGKDPLRARLLQATADPREEIAYTAVVVAGQRSTPEYTAALVRALDAPSARVVERALSSLSWRQRGAGDVIVKFLERPQLGTYERKYALQALSDAGEARHTAFLEKTLATREAKWSDAWATYFRLAPPKAVDLALVETLGEGEEPYRNAALEVLTQSTDARRIDVFRKILTGEAEGNTFKVLNAVHDQYLIELGAEALEHMRNPNAGLRELSRKCVERLKFYVEAKKTFEKKK